MDAAARGSIEAAEKLTVGYYNGDFGDRNLTKDKKWASYAAKHGSRAAREILSSLE